MLVGFNECDMGKYAIHLAKTYVFLSIGDKPYENSGLPTSLKFLGSSALELAETSPPN